MNKTYSPLEIANYFIELSEFTISPMKLQKLIYYAHGLFLAKNDSPLIDEQIEVWKYGPVIRSVYHEFKKYGNDKITCLVTVLKEKENPKSMFDYEFITPIVNKNDEKVIDFLNVIFKYYNQFKATTLSEMTHLAGTPWDTVVKEIGGIENLKKGTDLPENIIKDYFSKMINS